MAAKPAAKKPVAAKPAKPVKAKAPTRAQLQTEVATLQKDVQKLQTAATKHHPAAKTSKHSAAKKTAKKSGSAKHGTATTTKRGYALPGGVACCVAEGLAASLRLAGKRVGADDVLALYLSTPDADETGASILATLEAAQVYGLAGAYPMFVPAATPADGVVAGITLPYGPHTVTLERGGVWTWGEWLPVGRSFPDAVEEAWVITWL